MKRAERHLEVLAVIPARGGSKSIPRKNLALLAGEPLVVHTIRHARDASLVRRVVVSTEDHEIAEVALAHGAEVPFLRPPSLAGDEVLDWPVFDHVLRELDRRESYRPDLVVHLRPTAPWRKPGWIDTAVERLASVEAADSVRSVSLVREHPWRMFEIDTAGYLAALMADRHPAPWLLRRQDLPAVYYYNCVIDVTRKETILEQRSMTGARMLPFALDSDEVIDIDNPRDLRIAEALFGPRLRQASPGKRNSGERL